MAWQARRSNVNSHVKRRVTANSYHHFLDASTGPLATTVEDHSWYPFRDPQNDSDAVLYPTVSIFGNAPEVGSHCRSDLLQSPVLSLLKLSLFALTRYPVLEPRKSSIFRPRYDLHSPSENSSDGANHRYCFYNNIPCRGTGQYGVR